MATNDVNLQVINSMTQEQMQSLKDSDGKIPSLANQLIMTDEEDVNLSQWRTEVVYDMTSSDANKNWGYQTGIASSTTISNKDFNKYQALIIYSNRASDDYGSTMSFVPLDKTQDDGTYVGQSVIYLTRLTSANSLLANTLITTINSAKTSITITFKQQYNTNHYEEASYRAYKIEGILKTPAMIYTGKELHEGNLVSIKDGVVSVNLSGSDSIEIKDGIISEKSKMYVNRNDFLYSNFSNTANEYRVLYDGTFTTTRNSNVLISFGANAFGTSGTVAYIELVIDGNMVGWTGTNLGITGVSYVRSVPLSKGTHTYNLRIRADSGNIATLHAYNSVYLILQEV